MPARAISLHNLNNIIWYSGRYRVNFEHEINEINSGPSYSAGCARRKRRQWKTADISLEWWLLSCVRINLSEIGSAITSQSQSFIIRNTNAIRLVSPHPINDLTVNGEKCANQREYENRLVIAAICSGVKCSEVMLKFIIGISIRITENTNHVRRIKLWIDLAPANGIQINWTVCSRSKPRHIVIYSLIGFIVLPFVGTVLGGIVRCSLAWFHIWFIQICISHKESVESVHWKRICHDGRLPHTWRVVKLLSSDGLVLRLRLAYAYVFISASESRTIRFADNSLR